MTQRVGRAKGYLVETGPCGTIERETFTCSHCNRVGEVRERNAGQMLGVVCHSCFAYICPDCARVGRCEPFERKLEALERSARLRATC